MINSVNDTRALLVLEARRGGKTLRQIAERYGFSIERARQLVIRGEEVEYAQTSANPWFELSSRTRNALIADGCVPTPEGVAYHFHAGGLQQLLRVPNIGARSRAELNAWLKRHDEEPICE